MKRHRHPVQTAAFALTALVLTTVPPAAAAAPQKGIEVGDLDRSADPCNDFFQFANGTWRANNPIPATMPRWSRRWAAGEQAKDQLKEILEQVSKQESLPKGSVEQLIGDNYAACMDEERIDRLGTGPIDPLLKQIAAMQNAADLQAMIGKLHAIGVGVPFSLGGSSDPHDPGHVIADIFAGGLGLPDRDYYLKTEDRFKETREKYLAHVARMLALAGDDEAKARAGAATVLAMETKLAEASLDNVSLRDPKNIDHRTTFDALKTMAPHFDWIGYFRAAGLPAADLNVREPKFLEEFDRQIAATPLADWKIYLRWQLLQSAAIALPGPFLQASWEFYGRHLQGSREMKPRWKRCVETTDELLGEALGRKYVEKYFPPEAKARMQEMVKNLLLAMKDVIGGLTWMSPPTKTRALEKLATFNPKIGYPDRWKDYSKVVIRRDAWWEDVMAGRRFNVEDDRATIGKPVDRGRWGMTPPTSNAYYNALLNEIVFPAGILQPPAFSMDAVDAVNYGAIGVVIGHEISHGFDDEGAQYDAQGRLNNWWTAEDLKQFQARGQCVVDQFDGYFIEPGIHHNGRLVLGESIGDLAGAKIAWIAFLKSLEGKPPAPAIDGFTPAQQFFIAWGQFRGDAIRPEAQRLMMQVDPHPTGQYRVIGPLSNLTAFQEAFGCKEGSPMVRPAAVRCEVW